VRARTDRLLLLLTDAAMLIAAYALQYAARFEWQWFGMPAVFPANPWAPPLVLVPFWLTTLLFFGLYRSRFAASRFDEIATLLKAIVAGLLVLVFAIYIEALEPGSSRGSLLLIGASTFGFLALGRLVVRAAQKRLLVGGRGRHRALIVGWGAQVDEIAQEVARYPEAGLEIVGTLQLQEAGRSAPVAAGGDGFEADLFGDGAGQPPAIERLPGLIDELAVQDVLIALGSDDHAALAHVLQLCEGKPVTLKLVPDFYSVIGGMARTEHIYGLPLIEVLPVPMAPWEQSTKRLMDVAVSATILLAGLPLWLGVALLVRAGSPGPAIYRQRRVGQDGAEFTMLKFRTMVHDAEHATGPVWAQANDDRYTPTGRWLRKTRLDEVPQFWNVLKGEMSLVGPRPERPFFVEKLSQQIPLYSRRHRVKPGITGWAQIKRGYDASLDDVRSKVKYDLFYIENLSLGMDLKILAYTIRTALSGAGQ
jgi:exopolysaccharide biosynthesis polyprenyl glycosylphosphotransferase